MPEKQLTEDEADFINSVVSGLGYGVDAKSAANKVKAVSAAARAAASSPVARVVIKKAPIVVKRLPVTGAILDTALLSNDDTRESVFREVEDDAANAGTAKRMVKGALSPIATAAGIVNMASEANEMADKELLEAAEPDSRYLAKKKKAAMIKKARTDDASFAEAVERRLNKQA